MNSNKKSSGWRVNEDKFDADEHNRQIAARDESWGMGRLSDDTIQNPGGLRSQLLQLAATSDEAQAVLAAEGIALPTVPTKFRCSQGEIGSVVADGSGLWTASIVVDGRTVSYQSEDRDSTLMAVENFLEKSRGPRDLTEAELLRLARMVGRGETVAACELYVALRLNGKDRRSEREILEDPRYRKLLDEGAVTIWRFSRPEYFFDQEFEDLLARAAKTKPLSVNTVDCLFDLFQEQKAAAARSTRPAAPVAAPESEQPSQEEIQVGLENLTDRQLCDLKTKTLRERGQRVMAFDRQMFSRQ